MTLAEQMFRDPLIDGHENQAEFYAEIQAEADSARPTDDPELSPEGQWQLDHDRCEMLTELYSNIIFAYNGVTLVIDDKPLDANLSYLDAVEWREVIWGSFPESEIEIDWVEIQ
jgi:hypothetical protein